MFNVTIKQFQDSKSLETYSRVRLRPLIRFWHQFVNFNNIVDTAKPQSLKKFKIVSLNYERFNKMTETFFFFLHILIIL
jgi:hypothetical protein